jgi:O-antigen ligase
MRRSREKTYAWGLAVLAVLFMLVEWLRGIQFATPAAAAIQNGLIELVLSKSNQIFIIIALCCWFFILLWIGVRGRQNDEKDSHGFWHHLTPPEIYCAILLVYTGLVYAAGWTNAAVFGDVQQLRLGIEQTTNVLVFLTGLVLISLVGLLLHSFKAPKNLFRRIILLSLAVFLAAASCIKSVVPHIYRYRDETRWTGLWVNPNTFGLLMGVGVILAIGQLFLSLESKVQRYRNTECGTEDVEVWRRSKIMLYVVATGLCGIGLVKSYSRGAWLGTLIGCTFVFYHYRRTEEIEMFLGRHLSAIEKLSSLRKNRWILGVAACSIMALLMFRAPHAETRLAKRIISSMNANDFSWRNRILAWQGALQHIGDHPITGVGWSDVSKHFEEFYSSTQLIEYWSIILNDYLTLGMNLGIPGLACFVAYIWLRLSGPVAFPVNEDDWLRITSRTGAIVLLVGFFFDGGLLKLATCAMFCILLELGSEDATQS